MPRFDFDGLFAGQEASDQRQTRHEARTTRLEGCQAENDFRFDSLFAGQEASDELHRQHLANDRRRGEEITELGNEMQRGFAHFHSRGNRVDRRLAHLESGSNGFREACMAFAATLVIVTLLSYALGISEWVIHRLAQKATSDAVQYAPTNRGSLWFASVIIGIVIAAIVAAIVGFNASRNETEEVEEARETSNSRASDSSSAAPPQAQPAQSQPRAHQGAGARN